MLAAIQERKEQFKHLSMQWQLKKLGTTMQVWKVWGSYGWVFCHCFVSAANKYKGPFFLLALCVWGRGSRKSTEPEETNIYPKLCHWWVSQESKINTVLLGGGLGLWEMAFCCAVWLAQCQVCSWYKSWQWKQMLMQISLVIFNSFFVNMATAKQFVFISMK